MTFPVAKAWLKNNSFGVLNHQTSTQSNVFGLRPSVRFLIWQVSIRILTIYGQKAQNYWPNFSEDFCRNAVEFMLKRIEEVIKAKKMIIYIKKEIVKILRKQICLLTQKMLLWIYYLKWFFYMEGNCCVVTNHLFLIPRCDQIVELLFIDVCVCVML